MIFEFLIKDNRVSIDLKHKYYPLKDKHKFDFISIMIDDIEYDDIDLALLILNIDITNFYQIVLENFFKQN